MKNWICEITCIATKTILVEAETKKEALAMLKSIDGTKIGIDVQYGDARAHRVICQDGKIRPRNPQVTQEGNR